MCLNIIHLKACNSVHIFYSMVLIFAFLVTGCGRSSDQEKIQRELGKADTFFRAGLYKEALTHYQEALTIAPTDPALQVSLGLTYEALQLNRDALAAYDEALRFDPVNQKAHRQKILLLVKDGKINEAEKLIAGLDSKPGMEGLSPFLKGELAGAKKDWPKAIEFYTQANQIRPNSRETIRALGNALEQTGKRDDAIRLLDEFLKTTPDDFQIAMELAMLYADKGDLPRAIDSLVLLAQKNPTSAPIRSTLAGLYLEDGKDADAEREFKEALRLNPDDALALFISGKLALKAGNAQQALKDLEAAAQRRPGDERIRQTLREAQLAGGVIEEKVKVVTQKIKDQGEKPQLLLELADAYLYQGEPELALTNMGKVLSQDPENKQAHLLEALAFLSLGRLRDCAISLEKVQNKQDVRFLAMDGILRKDDAQVAKAADQLKSVSATAVWGSYFKGLGLIYNGQYGKGLEELNQLVDKNETFGAAIYEMARVYQSLNEPQLALALYQRVRQTFPDSLKPQLLSARILMTIGHRERAKVVIDSILKKYPDSQPTLFLLGTANLQDRNYAESAKVFQALVETTTQDLTERTFYRSILAKTLVFNRQYKEALEGYDRILQDNPSQATVYIEKSLAQMALNQDEAALATCETGLKAGTDTSVLHIVQAIILQQMNRGPEGLKVLEEELANPKWDQSAKTRLVPIHANLCISTGQFDLAKQVVQKSEYPNPLANYLMQMVDHAQAAKSDYKRLNLALLFSFYQWPDAALAIYGEMVKQSPTEKIMLAYLGDAQTLAGNYQEAIRVYSQALEQDKNDLYFLEQRSVAYGALNQHENAVKDILAALGLSSEAATQATPEGKGLTARLHFRLASLYEAQKLNEDAIASYQTVLTLSQDPAMTVAATNNLAWLLGQDEKTRPEAQTLAQQAVDQAVVNPKTGMKDGNILDTVGWVFFLAGKLDDARKYLEQALSALPTHPTINYHLGRVYEELKQLRVAVVQYSKALDYDPNFPEADDARIRAARLASELQADK